jgi:hypothetical protein
VQRGDLHRCEFASSEAPTKDRLASGAALLVVDRFAFTANNVTYAVVGDTMSYWNFFPAEGGWGRIPVWGFADVVASKARGVDDGQRLYGYFPMSTHLVVEPKDVAAAGFLDGAPHRAELPPIYNRYLRVENDPIYDATREDQQMLFWPLFATSFLIEDMLAESGLYGAERVVIASASSKTAIALAFLLSRNRAVRCEVVGLTSKRNASFVEGLGCYDRVVTYDGVTTVSKAEPIVLVDMAGDSGVIRAVHEHFRDLRYSCLVGVTHWERLQWDLDVPGPTPTFFFAPTQFQKRVAAWGPEELQRRIGAAWRPFVESTDGWLKVVHGRGRGDVERVYRETLEGETSPEEGHILSLG